MKLPRLHGRAFDLLLRLYPRRFRRAYGAEMAELFARRLARARGRGRRAVLGLWRRTIRDLMVTAVRERLSVGSDGRHTRDDDGEGAMRQMVEELGWVVRRLARAPLFTLGATGIVALGIGVNVAAFAVVDAVLLRPPPFADPDRVVKIYQDSDGGDPSSTSYPAYRDIAAHTDVFAAVAATSSASLVWEAEEGPRTAAVEFATASLMNALGLQPTLGRWFEPAHDLPGAGAWAVLSWRTWRTAFGADPAVVGRTIRLSGRPVTIVGVGPRDWDGSAAPAVTEIFLSISSNELGGTFRIANLDRREDHWYQVVARLAPGVPPERAQAAMHGLAERLAADFPELNRGRDITVFSAADVRVHPQADGQLLPAAGLLLGVVGLILVLACSNLANLLLVRGVSRAPEVALRRALGAGRGRVAGLFLTEALVLSALGGLAGFLLARGLLAVVSSLPVPGLGGTLAFPVDGRVALFTGALVLLTGALFGLAPALRSARTDLAGAMRDDLRTSTPGRGAAGLRNLLVAVQVAVSLVLLVGAGLLVRSFASAASVDAGVDVEGAAYLTAQVPPLGISQGEGTALLEALERRFESLPGVSGVARATRLPVQDFGGSTTTVVEGYVPPSGTGSVELLYGLVDEDYFDLLGIPVIEGRPFTPEDRASSAPVVILNETAARTWWGDASPLGRRIRPQGSPDGWVEVVGVVADARVRSLTEDPTPYIHYPIAQRQPGRVSFVARTDGDASELAAAMRAAAREVAPSLQIVALDRLDRHVEASMGPLRTASVVLGAFSAFALILASLGIYATVSFGVARRTSELGIRIALGAARGRVLGMVLREVLVTVGLGLTVGAVVAALLTPRLTGALYGVGGRAPSVLMLAACVLAAAALGAAWVPARRAASADPVEALRAR